MISVVINGKRQNLDRPIVLLSFIESLGIDTKRIAIAHNGSVLRKEELSSITIADGDEMEIVRAVGGGS